MATRAASAAATTQDWYVGYSAHVQNIGWQPNVYDGSVAGTTGQSLRMEALRVQLNPNQLPGVSVCYRAHVQNTGWQPEVCNNAVAGTTGRSLRMEAVTIRLIGAPVGWGICYAAHVQNIGWQAPVCNNTVAGTTGRSLRLEALRIWVARPTPPAPPNLNFTWDLANLNANDVPNGDTLIESNVSPVTLNACGSAVPAGTPYIWTFGNGAPPITSRSCSVTWYRPVSQSPQSVAVTVTIHPPSQPSLSLTRAISFRDVVIASLGDSAASGEGAPDSGRIFSLSARSCDRSSRAASAQAALRIQQALGSNVTVHFWFVACRGATINNVLSQVSRIDQLATASDLHVDRLLMTIGANDTPWAKVLTDCMAAGIGSVLFGPAAQDACVLAEGPAVYRALAALPSHFVALHDALADRWWMSPDHIYLTQYFDPVSSLRRQPPFCLGEVFAFPMLRMFAGSVENQLQGIVQANAAGGWHIVAGIRDAFQGHGVCSIDRWVNSWTDSLIHQGNLYGTWHPNDAGQDAMALIDYSNIRPAL